MPTASAGPPPDAARSQLRTLLAPVVGTAGYDLEDIVVSAPGGAPWSGSSSTRMAASTSTASPR